MLNFKNKKQVDTELAHTDVYHKGTYIGYYIKNTSKYAEVNENWNFVSKVDNVPHFPAKTKNELRSKLNSFLEVSK